MRVQSKSVSTSQPHMKIKNVIFELTKEYLAETFRDTEYSRKAFPYENKVRNLSCCILDYMGTFYTFDCDDINKNLNKSISDVFYMDICLENNDDYDYSENELCLELEIYNKEFTGNIRILEVENFYEDSFYNVDMNIVSSLSMGRTENSKIGSQSLACGSYATASGSYSTSLGVSNQSIGKSSFSQGSNNLAQGYGSFAQGSNTKALGDNSHSEGSMTTAKGNLSHVEGYGTIAGYCQHAQGKCNIEDTQNKYAFIIGNGQSVTNRSNAHTLDWQGNGWYQGKLSQDGTPTEDKDLVTKAYVDNSVANVDFPKVVDLGENPKLNENDYSLIENWTYGTGFFKITWTGNFDICLNNQGDVIYDKFWSTTPLYIFVERYVNTSDTKQIRFKNLINNEYFDAYYDIVDNVVTQYSYYQERYFNKADYYSKRDIDNKNYATEEYVDNKFNTSKGVIYFDFEYDTNFFDNKENQVAYSSTNVTSMTMTYADIVSKLEEGYKVIARAKEVSILGDVENVTYEYFYLTKKTNSILQFDNLNAYSYRLQLFINNSTSNVEFIATSFYDITENFITKDNLSFNEAGELVVTIDGVSKVFVAKS